MHEELESNQKKLKTETGFLFGVEGGGAVGKVWSKRLPSGTLWMSQSFETYAKLYPVTSSTLLPLWLPL